MFPPSCIHSIKHEIQNILPHIYYIKHRVSDFPNVCCLAFPFSRHPAAAAVPAAAAASLCPTLYYHHRVTNLHSPQPPFPISPPSHTLQSPVSHQHDPVLLPLCFLIMTNDPATLVNELFISLSVCLFTPLVFSSYTLPSPHDATVSPTLLGQPMPSSRLASTSNQVLAPSVPYKSTSPTCSSNQQPSTCLPQLLYITSHLVRLNFSTNHPTSKHATTVTPPS